MGNLAVHQVGSFSTQRLMLLGHSFILDLNLFRDLHSLTHILVHLGCNGKYHTLGDTYTPDIYFSQFEV